MRDELELKISRILKVFKNDKNRHKAIEKKVQRWRDNYDILNSSSNILELVKPFCISQKRLNMVIEILNEVDPIETIEEMKEMEEIESIQKIEEELKDLEDHEDTHNKLKEVEEIEEEIIEEDIKRIEEIEEEIIEIEEERNTEEDMMDEFVSGLLNLYKNDKIRSARIKQRVMNNDTSLVELRDFTLTLSKSKRRQDNINKLYEHTTMNQDDKKRSPDEIYNSIFDNMLLSVEKEPSDREIILIGEREKKSLFSIFNFYNDLKYKQESVINNFDMMYSNVMPTGYIINDNTIIISTLNPLENITIYKNNNNNFDKIKIKIERLKKYDISDGALFYQVTDSETERKIFTIIYDILYSLSSHRFMFNTLYKELSEIEIPNLILNNRIKSSAIKYFDKIRSDGEIPDENKRSFVLFLKNLYKNNNDKVIEDAFDYLVHNSFHINKAGNILTYKAVSEHRLDKHTHSISNKDGEVVSIDKADTNGLNSCSYGLHVGSWKYVSSFANIDDHIIICEVNPKNIAAIPSHDTSKMRCFEYRVLRRTTLQNELGYDLFVDID
jgi:hypothetical protein